MKIRLGGRPGRRNRSPREIRCAVEDTITPAIISRGEEKGPGHRHRRLEREVDDFELGKAQIQIRSGSDAARNGDSDETAAARLEVRRHLDGISSAGPQRAHHERTQTSGSRMDALQF